jgi:hypothetical protein
LGDLRHRLEDIKRILKEENKMGLDSSGSEEGIVNMAMSHRISQIKENN